MKFTRDYFYYYFTIIITKLYKMLGFFSQYLSTSEKPKTLQSKSPILMTFL